MKILDILKDRHKQGKKSMAVLVDPDKIEGPGKIKHLLNLASGNCVDFFFVGGSLITTSNVSHVVQDVKENVGRRAVFFPCDYGARSLASEQHFFCIISLR